MIFTEPAWLWALLSLPVALVVLFFQYVHDRRALMHLVPRYASPGFQRIHVVKWFLTRFFALLSWTLVILSMAGPQWGETFVEEERRGLDVVMVLDVSRSMLVQDVVPDRLTRAREVLLGTLSQLGQTRLGLVAFRGAGAVVVPLTEDRFAMDQALSTISPESLTAPGTGLKSGLEKALSAFPEGEGRYRAIVLVSDGGEQSEGLRDLGLKAAERGIPIFTIGLGTEAGGPVPGTAGQVVLSRLNAAGLEELARLSRGRYLGLEEASIYNNVAQAILDDQSLRQAQGFRIASVPRHGFFLFAAILSMILSLLVQSLRWGKEW